MNNGDMWYDHNEASGAAVSVVPVNSPSESEAPQIEPAKKAEPAKPKAEKKTESFASGIAWLLGLALIVCVVFMTAERFWPESVKTSQTVAPAFRSRIVAQVPQRLVQEKIVYFKPGEPVNTGFEVQLGDLVHFINPTERFKFVGTSKTHIIYKTTVCTITNGGVLVINGFEKEGSVKVKIVPQ